MRHTYQNEYGRLVLEVISEYKQVSTFKSKEFDPACFFGIDDAEKIALITRNDGIQLGFPMWDHKKAYMVHHQSAHIAALCRIVSLEYDSDLDATKELDRLNRYVGPRFDYGGG